MRTKSTRSKNTNKKEMDTSAKVSTPPLLRMGYNFRPIAAALCLPDGGILRIEVSLLNSGLRTTRPYTHLLDTLVEAARELVSSSPESFCSLRSPAAPSNLLMTREETKRSLDLFLQTLTSSSRVYGSCSGSKRKATTRPSLKRKAARGTRKQPKGMLSG